MDCDDIQSHLSAYRDGEGSARRRWRMRLHLSKCEKCRRQLHGLEAVCELLDDAPQPPPISDDFTRQVVNRARQCTDGETGDQGTTDRRSVASLWGVAAAAAVLVVGVGSGLIAGAPMWSHPDSAHEQPEVCLHGDYSSSVPPGSLADVYRDVDDPTVY